MNGTAIYLGVCTMFIANAIGMPLTFPQMITVIATATLAAVGTAGIPGSGVLMLLMVFDSRRTQNGVEPGGGRGLRDDFRHRRQFSTWAEPR